MKLNSVKIHQNYEKILENVKKYSPYPEKVKILFVSKYLNVEEHKAVIDMGYDYFGENRAQLYRDKLNEFSDEKYKNIKWDFTYDRPPGPAGAVVHSSPDREVSHGIA